MGWIRTVNALEFYDIERLPALHTGTPLAHGGGHPWHTAGGAGLGRSGRGLRGGSGGEGGRGRRSLEFRSRPKDSMTALPENNF